MKKAKFSGKLLLKKMTISNLTSSSITGGTATGAPHTCDNEASCDACGGGGGSYNCSAYPCTSGTTVNISC